MLITGLIAAWLGTSAAAFWLFTDDWRRRFDATRADLLFFASLSALGPISLVAGLIIWGIGWPCEHENPIVWGRK